MSDYQRNNSNDSQEEYDKQQKQRDQQRLGDQKYQDDQEDDEDDQQYDQNDQNQDEDDEQNSQIYDQQQRSSSGFSQSQQQSQQSIKQSKQLNNSQLNSSQQRSSGGFQQSQQQKQQQNKQELMSNYTTPKYQQGVESSKVSQQQNSSISKQNSVASKQNTSQISQKDQQEQNKKSISADQFQLKCNIHHQDIVKVCGKKECKEKMFFCLECIEEFAEHVVKHRPFVPIKQFLQELQDNPHTQRKEKIEQLQQENSTYVKKFLQQINSEKTRVAQKVIPALKTVLTGLCDQLQARIYDEIDQFSYVYQYNSKFLTSYLDQNGLLTEILDQVPSFTNIFQKYEENQGSKQQDFIEYLEKVYRRILNNGSVEQTRQAFGYFEEIFDNFRKQGDDSPIFVGESALVEKIQQVFNEFVEKNDQRYSSVISQYPICSSCNKEVDSEQSTKDLQKRLNELETQLKNLQKNTSSTPTQSASNKKDTLASQTTPVSKVGQSINSKTEDIKTIQKEIERLQKSKPGCCKGCRRLYCITCQDQSYCKGCRIEFDSTLKTSKFVIKESKGFPVAMLDDTQKQGVVSSTQGGSMYGGSLSGTVYGTQPSLNTLTAQLKKLNIGLMLGSQELYSGRYEWEVVVENNGQCHSIGFGLCKLDELKLELDSNKDLKDLTDKKSLIVVTSNGTVSGGLKGRIQSFQKEKNSMIFVCLLDFGKNKFSITGKNIYLEKDLENNQGYIPCFYAGCCFKSYNNFTIKQKYQYDPFIMKK